MSRKSGFGRSIEEYVVGGELGRGGFATVHQAQCCNTGFDVAIKKIERRQIDERGMRQRVKEEVDIHARLDHPSILRLYNFFEDSQYVYLVLELCRNGELQKSLKNMDRVLYENEARVCLHQIVQGMLYLHSNSIMHRDLTLSNILIDDSGCLKIADFGLATRLSHPNDRHTTMCGTPNYISPEVVTRDPHGLESDVWSLGCMMYVMLVGHAPFDTRGVKEAILTRVANAEYEVPSNLSAEARSLIVACLQKNPKKRIPLKNVLLHPFMVGSKDGEPSDSGLYTMTTMATTHHPRAAPFAITEERSERSRREAMGQANICSEPFLRHPPSPPVRMKSNPRNLLPSYTGIIDNLKRKYTPLPSLRRGEDFAFTAPSLPPFSKRERDVSEERQKLQLHQEREEAEKHWRQSQVHEREVSHERQKQHHQQNPVSDARYSYSSQSSSTTGRLDRVEANPQNHNIELERCAYNYLPTPILPQHSRTSEEMDYSHSNNNRQGGHNMRERGCNSYSDHKSRSLERESSHGHDEIIGEVRGRVARCIETGDRSRHRHLSQSRDRLEGEQEPNTSLSSLSHSIGKSVHQPRSRSVDNYQGGSRVSHRAHSCCQGSQDHRSWCDRRVVADKEDFVYGGSRHSENESRHCSSNSKDQRFASVGTHQASSRHHSTQENQQDKILNNIPSVFHSSPPAENFNITSVPPQQVPPGTPSKQISASISRPSLSQQVSPISSHRLKKVRYPSKRYLLNILENGEICLEQLKIGAGQQQQQKVVEDVCWISPDGFRIVIYQPDRGRGYVSGDMPPPKPEKGGDHFSYDNLPTKYWRKYKDAARFVKLVKSRTTKITYYSKEAKFYLMENSPDPDFVALFYHGTKVTKSKNSVVVREPIGVSHPVSYNTSLASLPDYLHSLYEHFKQAHAHCLHLDHVLSEATNKTGLSCFPVILGRKLPPTTTSPPLAVFPTAPATTRPSQCGGHQDKENLSPSSSASSFRARNNLPQLPSFEGSMVSTQVANPQNTPPPLVRIPFANCQPSNSLQAVRAHTPPVTQESPVCVNIPNIGRAYKEEDELRVDYINGAQIWTTSNSPQLKYRPNSNAELKLYTTSETLSQDLKEKLGEFPGILSALKKKQLMEQKQQYEKIMVQQEITRTCHSSSLR